MADETTDVSATEQMSICIRFVNSNMEVCEEFLGFVKLTKMDAQSVFDVLIPTLEGWGLDGDLKSVLFKFLITDKIQDIESLRYLIQT